MVPKHNFIIDIFTYWGKNYTSKSLTHILTLDFMRAACHVIPELPRGETCPTRLADEGPLSPKFRVLVVFPSREFIFTNVSLVAALILLQFTFAAFAL